MQVSYFEKGITQVKPSVEYDVEKLIGWIRDGLFKTKIEKLRSFADNKALASTYKQSLPYVTWSGTFKKRSNKDLIAHSGFICLDIDHVPADRYTEIFTSICKDNYTFAAWRSPSGDGIKVLVKINHNAHAEAFLLLEKSYKTSRGIEIDKSGKDIARACFVSYDPDLYHNPDSWLLNIQPEINIVSKPPDTNHQPPTTNPSTDYSSKFTRAHNFCKKKCGEYAEGNRNNYIFFFACHCNRLGIPEFDCTEYSISEFHDLPEAELRATVASAYKHHTGEHGKMPHEDRPARKPKAPEATPAPEAELNALVNQTKEKANAGRQKRQIERTEEYLNLNFAFRNNVIKNEIEVTEFTAKHPDLMPDSVWTELNENELFRRFQHDGIPFTIPKTLCLLKSSFVPHFNPFEQYFKQLPKWDGVDHIKNLAGYVSTRTDHERFERHLRKHLVRTVACALRENYFNKHCFVLVSPAQHTGKTTFCKYLCPPALNEYYTENIALDKDALMSLCENLIINLDELAALSKFEINHLKSVFSKDAVKLRPPFEKRARRFPRVCTFVGSTNRTEFLTDETGSVRWLCFEIASIDFNYITEVDINKVYAQALHLLNSDFEFKLTAAEIVENETSNQKFQVNTPEYELIAGIFEKATEQDGDFKTASDIVLRLGEKFGTTIKFNSVTVGRAMAALGFDKASKYSTREKYAVKGYYVREIETGATGMSRAVPVPPVNETAVPAGAASNANDDLPF